MMARALIPFMPYGMQLPDSQTRNSVVLHNTFCRLRSRSLTFPSQRAPLHWPNWHSQNSILSGAHTTTTPPSSFLPSGHIIPLCLCCTSAAVVLPVISSCSVPAHIVSSQAGMCRLLFQPAFFASFRFVLQ